MFQTFLPTSEKPNIAIIISTVSINRSQDGQCAYNKILTRLRITIVTVKKDVLHILNVCL